MIHGGMQLSVQHNRPNKDCQPPLHAGCCFVSGVTGGIVTLWYFAFDYNGTPSLLVLSLWPQLRSPPLSLN